MSPHHCLFRNCFTVEDDSENYNTNNDEIFQLISPQTFFLGQEGGVWEGRYPFQEPVSQLQCLDEVVDGIPNLGEVEIEAEEHAATDPDITIYDYRNAQHTQDERENDTRRVTSRARSSAFSHNSRTPTGSSTTLNNPATSSSLPTLRENADLGFMIRQFFRELMHHQSPNHRADDSLGNGHNSDYGNEASNADSTRTARDDDNDAGTASSTNLVHSNPIQIAQQSSQSCPTSPMHVSVSPLRTATEFCISSSPLLLGKKDECTTTKSSTVTAIHIPSIALEEVVLPGSNLQRQMSLSLRSHGYFAQEPMEDECVICMEPFDETNPRIPTLCGCGENNTCFHLSCLYEWVGKMKSEECPSCRQTLTWQEFTD